MEGELRTIPSTLLFHVLNPAYHFISVRRAPHVVKWNLIMKKNQASETKVNKDNNTYLRNSHKKLLNFIERAVILFLLPGSLNVERMKSEGMVLFSCRDDCIVSVIFVLICSKSIDIDNDVSMTYARDNPGFKQSLQATGSPTNSPNNRGPSWSRSPVTAMNLCRNTNWITVIPFLLLVLNTTFYDLCSHLSVVPYGP